MSKDTRGLNLLDVLEVGTDELQWLQAEIDQAKKDEWLGRIATAGWFGTILGTGQAWWGWSVNENGSTGALRRQLHTAAGGPYAPAPADVPAQVGGVARDGSVIVLDDQDDGAIRDANGDPITVPDDATWYTLIARRGIRLDEPGRLTFIQNNASVTGDNTQFTRYSDGSDPVATKIRIDAADSANGNEGTYTIDTITDDGTMTITPAPTGADESGLKFHVQGRFFSTPAGTQDIHWNEYVEWELVARTVAIPDDALIAYDVYRDTGADPNVQFLDRRHVNMYRPMPHNYKLELPSMGSGFFQADTQTFTRNTAAGWPWTVYDATAPQHFDACPAYLGADEGPSTLGWNYDANNFALVAIADATQIEIVTVRTLIEDLRVQNHANAGSPVTAVSEAGIDSVAITNYIGGNHIIAYTVGGVCKVLTSDDQGATWSSAATIWDPTTIDASDLVDGVEVVALQSGRIIVAASYYDDSAGERDIRYVYSDDYGATWDTNSQAGHVAISQAGQDMQFPRLAQDGFGRLHGMYVDTSDGGIHVWSSDTEDLPDHAAGLNRNVNGTKLDDPGNLVAGRQNYFRGDMYANEDGILHCYTVSIDDTSDDQYLNFLAGYRDEVLNTYIGMVIDGGATAIGAGAASAMVRLPNGMGLLLWLNNTSGSEEIKGLPLSMRVIPTRNNWFPPRR